MEGEDGKGMKKQLKKWNELIREFNKKTNESKRTEKMEKQKR
jgi:flagellar capping protein FliD